MELSILNRFKNVIKNVKTKNRQIIFLFLETEAENNLAGGMTN